MRRGVLSDAFRSGDGEGISKSSGMLDAGCFAELLGTTRDEIAAACGELINGFDFRYDYVAGNDRDAVILKVIKAIDSGNFKVSGKERKDDWEQGWQENLDAFIASGYSIDALAPKYISKYDVSRLFSKYVRTRDRAFELNFYTVFRQYLFLTYFKTYRNIFEFGCGTGYNLAIMNRLFPDKRIMGLDWAGSSVKIADALGTHLKAPISGRRFDYYHPDHSLDIPAESVLITLNSLEQLGGDYGAFLDFVLEKKPSLCINAEPILEMYDENNLVDYLAIRYHNARNYLAGYYDALKRLEADGRIRIVREKRIPIGNFFHEGYSLIVWHVV